MKIFPSIDIRDGKVVRLKQGDYDRMTVYGDSPRAAALDFREKGAKNLHIVDLSGARSGEAAEFDSVAEVVAAFGGFTEVGGGIRTEARIESYLSLGVSRVILGTIAVENFSFVEEMVKKYGGRIAVGVDTRDGLVAIKGWEETSALDGFDFCVKLRDAGVKTVICTDISRDCMLSGTNVELYTRLARIEGLDIIASGGVTYLEEIERLASAGVAGAIVGNALYTGTLDAARLFAMEE